MEQITLGNSDLKVSRLCLGWMSFGDPASTTDKVAASKYDRMKDFGVQLSLEDVAYLEELYVPHKVVGAL